MTDTSEAVGIDGCTLQCLPGADISNEFLTAASKAIDTFHNQQAMR